MGKGHGAHINYYYKIFIQKSFKDTQDFGLTDKISQSNDAIMALMQGFG